MEADMVASRDRILAWTRSYVEDWLDKECYLDRVMEIEVQRIARVYNNAVRLKRREAAVPINRMMREAGMDRRSVGREEWEKVKGEQLAKLREKVIRKILTVSDRWDSYFFDGPDGLVDGQQVMDDMDELDGIDY